MRIKLDENLPSSMADLLTRAGHDVDTSPQEDLIGADDQELWQAAQATERFLITQDLDFSDIRRFAPGTHFGLLLIRLDHPSRRALLERMRQILETENIESWRRCLVVATRHKIRVRRPVE
jgi:predicted nuclease of predicted toxin-antitoxin system